MIDFNLKYFLDLSTSANDENYYQHVSEDTFYRFFLLTKDSWKKKFVEINQLINIDFITHGFTMKISKELFHPSTVHIVLEDFIYEGLSLKLSFLMYHHEKLVANCSFKLVPVDTCLRKVISKSSLYEKVQFN